jgi:uncharacterized protein
MYLFKTFVQDSSIEGKGVFAGEDIAKGDIVWKFDPHHDLTLSQEDFEKLDKQAQLEIRKIGYL